MPLDTKSLSAAPHDTLAHASEDLLRHPKQDIVCIWSWKTAAVSALFRASIFLVTNRHTGLGPDLRAAALEATFAIFASGLLGAVTQRFRDARPIWATALAVWIGMPALMTLAQWAVHRAGHTANMLAGLIGSFAFASVASGFTWFSMRRGVLLAGPHADPFLDDLRQMPRILGQFLTRPWQRTEPT